MKPLVKNLLFVCLAFGALAVTGCGPGENKWTVRTIPTTDEERRLIAEHTAKLVTPPPSSLEGDPDWDDAILAAHQVAVETYCRKTLWEWDGDRWTGRWRYVQGSNEGTWVPRPGEKVWTNHAKDGRVVEKYVTTVTKVEGSTSSQSGVIVFSEDLPGVDLWWVQKFDANEKITKQNE